MRTAAAARSITTWWGRIGLVSGPWSDLRLGLAKQTVMNGEVPTSEPMRLTIVEAPRERIDKLIERHDVLKYFYRNEWVHLVGAGTGGRYIVSLSADERMG